METLPKQMIKLETLKSVLMLPQMVSLLQTSLQHLQELEGSLMTQKEQKTNWLEIQKEKMQILLDQRENLEV